jgi:hypothetical protein
MNSLIKKISGYEDYYEIDINGNVYSVERFVKKWDGLRKIERCFKKQSLCNSGYLRVNLSKNGSNKKHLVHRLVAIEFIENPFNKSYVNHKDGNKLNNNASNLEWVTKSENTIHAINVLNKKIGFKSIKGEAWYKTKNKPNPAKKSVLMLDKENNFIKEFDSLTEAGLFLNKHPAQIMNYIQGKRNNKQYNFKYKNKQS